MFDSRAPKNFTLQFVYVLRAPCYAPARFGRGNLLSAFTKGSHLLLLQRRRRGFILYAAAQIYYPLWIINLKKSDVFEQLAFFIEL